MFRIAASPLTYANVTGAESVGLISYRHDPLSTQDSIEMTDLGKINISLAFPLSGSRQLAGLPRCSPIAIAAELQSVGHGKSYLSAAPQTRSGWLELQPLNVLQLNLRSLVRV
ncbi:hypothetical protein [Rosistilla oblonga]|uniref:hypothetical protein n=1 Tax=Rosistilla oblonga TaxID=2527990 RepID=UPI003A981A56